MTCYDVALYIGFNANIAPEKVYVHRGVIKGAYNLKLTEFKSKNVVLNYEDCIAKHPELEALGEAYHVENVLCLNNDKI